jgi:hypothetical protein
MECMSTQREPVKPWLPWCIALALAVWVLADHLRLGNTGRGYVLLCVLFGVCCLMATALVGLFATTWRARRKMPGTESPGCAVVLFYLMTVLAAAPVGSALGFVLAADTRSAAFRLVFYVLGSALAVFVWENVRRWSPVSWPPSSG